MFIGFVDVASRAISCSALFKCLSTRLIILMYASANLWLLLVFVQESLHFLQIFEVADDVVDMILSLLFGQEFGIT